MGTYNHKQVLLDYTNGKITAEMAVGHSLQHIGQLYEAQRTAEADHRAWQTKVNHLEDELKTLRAEIDRWQKQQPRLDRLQTLENNLTALNVTVYQLKDEVDHLQARLSDAGPEAPSATN
jgi:chromosome segregation ATPase